MKSRYTFVARQILILLMAVGIGGPIAVAGAADVTVPKGTIKRTTGSAVKVQNAPMKAADKAQEQKITDTMRQMGFNVTGISKGANGQYNVRVNKFEASKATSAFKGVLAFRGNVRGTARQVGAANMNRGLRNAGGADVDSIQTPVGGGQAGGGNSDSIPTPGGGATPGGPSIGDFEGGGGLGGDGISPGNDGPGGDGIGPGDDGISPGNDGPGGDGIGPGDDGIGPGNDGPGGDGLGPDGGDNPGSTGPGSGDAGPGPTTPDDGGGNPPSDNGNDGSGGNPPPDNGDDDDGGGPPTDPDEGGSGRVLNRDAASRGIARGNTQIDVGRTALTTGGTAVLNVMVSKTGVLSISRQSLANAGLNNQVPSAANGNVMFQ
jgi:hypothetical protein